MSIFDRKQHFLGTDDQFDCNYCIISRKLLSQIEQFKSNACEKPESECSPDESSGIVYQFSYRPEHARLEQTARLSELEARLHRLENVLGATDEKLSRLTTGTKKG